MERKTVSTALATGYLRTPRGRVIIAPGDEVQIVKSSFSHRGRVSGRAPGRKTVIRIPTEILDLENAKKVTNGGA